MLNWYRIERILGRGGFGVIYLATDTNLDHQFAVKEYLPSDLATRTQDTTVHPINQSQGDMFRWGMERFIKEARNLVKFKHPNIVRVMSVFQQNNTAYMVMEFEEGMDLRSYLRKPGGSDEAELKRLILPISKGLAEVHRHGFIHRDIKPANILVRNDGSPVLIDFGSARSASKYTQQSLTALVSVGYAPLEQYNEESEEQQGPWTDIYALGGTLYYAVTGKDPVESTRRATALFNGGKDPLISAERLGEGRFSPEFLKAIDWALQFRIADRPQTLADWMPALLEEPSSGQSQRIDADLYSDMSDATVLARDKSAFSQVSARSNETSSRGKGLFSIALVALLFSAAAFSVWFAGLGNSSKIEGDNAAAQIQASNNSTVIDAAPATPSTQQRAVDTTSADAIAEKAQRAQQVAQQKEQEQKAAAEKAEQMAAKAQEEAEAKRLAAEKLALEQAAAQAQERAKSKQLALDAEAAEKATAKKEEQRLAAIEAKAAKEAEQARLAAQKIAQKEAQIKAAADSAARSQRRLKQAILASQNSLSVGDISAAQRQLAIAKSIDADDTRVETLAFAIEKAVAEQDKPVSDAEFDAVARMFDGLRRAIESKDAQAMDRLAISSSESALFKALMQRFERLDVSIVGIRVRNADKSISGSLRIDSMVRENGDRATPSNAYQSRVIKSKRVNGGWSKIEW